MGYTWWTVLGEEEVRKGMKFRPQYHECKFKAHTHTPFVYISKIRKVIYIVHTESRYKWPPGRWCSRGYRNLFASHGFCCSYETGSQYVTKAGLQLNIKLAQTHSNSPASASPTLGFQVCTILLRYVLFLELGPGFTNIALCEINIKPHVYKSFSYVYYMLITFTSKLKKRKG